MISPTLLNDLERTLAKIPAQWDGRRAILEMKNAKYPHWRQMEWIGFYFQFLCDTILPPLLTVPGPTYKNVTFDGLGEVPWDFKAHPVQNAQGVVSTNVIVNDRVATQEALEKFGKVGIILAVGEATFDTKKRDFQIWHSKLKGGLSRYERTRIARGAPSRLRKTAFALQKIDLILLDADSVTQQPSFQKDFRNSDGSPRNAKVLLDLKTITPIRTIRFA